MSEFKMRNLSHFGCIKSTISTGLRQMYIDSFFPNLDMGIKISNGFINSPIIDPEEGCFLVKCTFLLQHIILKIGKNLKKNTKESFHVFSFDDKEEKVPVRFEGEKGQDAIYEITLYQSFNPEQKLPIDPSIRFLCVAHPASGFAKVAKGPWNLTE